MKKSQFEEILADAPVIDSGRNYWFVRTEGGLYYENFIKGSYIAIGYNEISLADIQLSQIPRPKAKKARDLEVVENTSSKSEEAERSVLLSPFIERIKNIYKSEKRPGYIGTQLEKFVYGINKGDVVIIPSENSHMITFGEVVQTRAYIQEKTDECKFEKRKKVKWLKTVYRDSLDTFIYKLAFSQHAISEANLYGKYIDKYVNTLFIKDNVAHLILDVQTRQNIKAKDLFDFGSASLHLLDEFCEEEGIENTSDYNIKLNLQSPGIIEITAVTALGVIALGIIFICISGGGFTSKFKNKDGTTLDITVKTDGIIEKMRTFLNSKSSRKDKAKIIEKALTDLDIKEPKDLIDILNNYEKK